MGTALQEHSIAENMVQSQQLGQANHHTTTNATQDNDSLTNSIQSQTTMFTQTIHQMVTLAECQVVFKDNTQSVLETIMQQLAEINWHNWKHHLTQQYGTNHHDYSDEDNHSRLATANSMEEDISNT